MASPAQSTVSPATADTALSLPFARTASRLSTYPVVADVLSLYKSSILGPISVSAYSTLSPIILKLARRPYQVVSPIVNRADDLVAEQGLSILENALPIVKKDTVEVREVVTATATTVATWPLRLLSSGKQRVLATIHRAEEQARSDVISARDWALVWVDHLRQKVDEAGKAASGYANQASEAVSEFRSEPTSGPGSTSDSSPE